MRACLRLEGGKAYPEEFPLDGARVFRLGRNRECHIVLRDEHASRLHAEIYRENGQWMLRDLKTTNGTRLNGIKMTANAPLTDGCEIRVGEVRLRFLVEVIETPTDELQVPPDLLEEERCVAVVEEEPSDLEDRTVFQQDELSALLTFMDNSLLETTSAGVLQLALRTIHRQTNATITGFLSLDESDALPKMVLPEMSKVDIHLSRQLTQQVRRDRRTARAPHHANGSSYSTESLVSFQDAFCVPVRGEEVPLGALHVYRSGANFSERDVRFCEALASYLSRCLLGLRTRHALEADNSRLRTRSTAGDREMIGASPPMLRLRDQIRKLSQGPKVVLICGESGSGKELVASELHRLSARAKGPLVTVNCAAIASSMYEAELFGHCKGSFTGALTDHPGFFQQAEMGTLFLDEIGELSEDCQAKLLRVLEYGTFRPVGARSELKADVRIIAATNRDLNKECIDGTFRADLFFRLGLQIKVPPLRERRDDIAALAEHILKRLSTEYKRTASLTPEALEKLEGYRWPGNVRQLRTVLEYALAMGEGSRIEAEDLHLDSDGRPPTIQEIDEEPEPVVEPQAEDEILNLSALEGRAIRQALARTGGTISQAAKLLGIHRDTLGAKMAKLRIGK